MTACSMYQAAARFATERTPSLSSFTNCGDGLDRPRGGAVLGIEGALQGVDQGRAHHDPVGPLRHRRRMGAALHAEAHHHRQGRMALDPLHRRRDLAEIRRRRAGDAGDRDVIDEARRVREHRRQALVVRGRGGQPDEGEAGLERRQAQLVVLLRRQVDDDQAVDARLLGIGKEAVDAVDVDRVEIAHEDHGRVRILGPEAADEVEGLDRVLPHLQGPQARRLDRRAVGHGIGEGQPELDDVGPGLRQALQDLERGLGIRIAGHHIGDEGGAAFRAALLRNGLRCVGSWAGL